jgi:hypothetical protein
MNELSVITQLPDLKQIGVFKQNIKDEIFKAGARLFKELSDDDDIRQAVMKEAEKEGLKSFEKNGIKFTIKEAGTKYDYSGCCDAEYNYIIEVFNTVSNQKKEREEFLKTITSGSEIYGKDGFQIIPPVKTSQTIVEVKL